MNKVIINKDEERVIYSKAKNVIYEVLENAKLIIYQYEYNDGNDIVINLNGENALVECHFSFINYDDNKFKIVINHNASNTISNIYNHGVNINDKLLEFDVTSVVPKSSFSCVVNQENQIINLNDGNSKIDPKLLIENYDVSSSHSAYIGSFKESSIFYLMSRGVSKISATKLLIKSLLLNGGNEEEKEVMEFLEKIKEV